MQEPVSNRSLGARFLSPLLVTACLLTTACSTTSASFVEGLSGYSVTRGRITRLDGLHSEKLQPLADGVAITLSRPGQIALQFGADQRRLMDLRPGAILVCGAAADYVARIEDGDAALPIRQPGSER